MFTEITGLDDGDLTVRDCSIEITGVYGTLYNGDADLISDFLAAPAEPLDIHGCLHHINLTHDAGTFTLLVESPMYNYGTPAVARFGHMAARALVFALAGVKPYAENPNRP